MLDFLTILIIIACVLLVLVVLIQNPKGGGLSSGFGSANQLGGVRQTTNILEKLTWGLAICIFVLSLAAAPLSRRSAPPQEQEQQQQQTPQPTGGADQNTGS